VEAARARYREECDQSIARLEREFDDRRRQTEDDLTRERQTNATLRGQVDRLEARLEAFQERFADVLPGPKKLVTARQPDGRILTAIPGDEVVYIDRGRKDRLTLGLRFAVYPTDTGIPADGQAKAQIEVVSIFDESAECKKNRVDNGQVILPGDLIANPIYDENRPVRFVVVGEFDLDHDGTMDRNGATVIEAMIADWGGTVSAQMTALTDFVVLGAVPRQPRPVRDSSAEGAARFDRMKQVYDHYEETRKTAYSLAVPILRQDVFLNFLGYTDRSVLR
jgi:hypothetical protein